MTQEALEIDVKRLRLEPGDVLVVRTDRPVSHEQADAIRRQIALAGLPGKVLVHGPELTLGVLNHTAFSGEPACPVDAQNGSESSPLGSTSESGLASPTSSESSLPLAEQVQQLMQSHRELVTLLTTLIEQNAETLERISTVLDEVDDEPQTYLDGTPVKHQ